MPRPPSLSERSNGTLGSSRSKMRWNSFKVSIPSLRHWAKRRIASLGCTGSFFGAGVCSTSMRWRLTWRSLVAKRCRNGCCNRSVSGSMGSMRSSNRSRKCSLINLCSQEPTGSAGIKPVLTRSPPVRFSICVVSWNCCEPICFTNVRNAMRPTATNKSPLQRRCSARSIAPVVGYLRVGPIDRC